MQQQEEIPEIRCVPPNEYFNLLNRTHLQRTTLGVARYMASRADYGTGKNIFPGEETIGAECGLKRRAVREHLKILRDLKLLTRVRHNSGRYGYYDEYWLTWPLDWSAVPMQYGPERDPDKPLPAVRLPRKRDNEKPRY